MGRFVLLISTLAPLWATGCAPEIPPAASGAPGDPHASLTCASCHEYRLATPAQLAVDRLLHPDSVAGQAPVPEETCTTAGCHADQGPREVEFRSLSFEHRQHGGDTVVAMGCVACHAHQRGGEPLTAGLDPCSLCHLGAQSAGNMGECRQCHSSLDHISFSSQGVEVPHEGLSWLDGGCVRCHYDVTRARIDVPALSCRGCHSDEDQVLARGIGEDLHLSHVAVGCMSCHEGEAHRIRAMSSSVALICAECHREPHAVPTSVQWPGTATCNACHTGAHLEQQQMVLGLVPVFEDSDPSVKFIAGLTCTSCHQPALSLDPAAPVRAPAESCQGCHPDEYATVLEWWQRGGETRVARVQSALRSARQQIPATGDPLARLDSAQLLVEVVQAGRPEHNLLLSHRILVRASDLVTEAYVLAGRPPPSQPALGRQPHEGLCSYCHYRADDPWLFEEMSGPFHREALGIRPRR